MTDNGHMKVARLLTRIAGAPRLRRRTVRRRLTLLYGGLFLVSGVVLLAITYVLVRHATGHVLIIGTTGSVDDAPVTDATQLPEPLRASVAALRAKANNQRDSVLNQLLIQSGIALAIMSVASVGLGWLMAGRVLRPLRSMTAATQRISHDKLHERLAVDGPRDELKDLGDTIDELLARLEEAFDAQRRFVANASHELRTPLAMMRTSVDVATGKPDPIPAPVAALGTKIREGLDQADRLLESFLSLAYAQNRELSDIETVALGPLVGAALDRHRAAITDQGIAVEEHLGHVEVDGSRTLLTRMIDNLLDNAVRHNQPNGWLRIETRSSENEAVLLVENGGAPLDPHDVRHVAEPFRRLGADRVGSENGVGLGLSIVAAIAAAHAGHLELTALREGGLGATVTLPTSSALTVATRAAL
jgi:signal transduction histidine kinase